MCIRDSYDPDDPEKMYVEGDRATLGAEVLYAVLGVTLLVPVSYTHLLVLGAGAGQRVQLFDNGHQLRHNGIQIGAGPLFQCFGQNGVVGVGAGLCDRCV